MGVVIIMVSKLELQQTHLQKGIGIIGIINFDDVMGICNSIMPINN